jgi:hypothetical protein
MIPEGGPKPTPREVFVRELVRPTRQIYPYISGFFSGVTVMDVAEGRYGRAMLSSCIAVSPWILNVGIEVYLQPRRLHSTNRDTIDKK